MNDSAEIKTDRDQRDLRIIALLREMNALNRRLTEIYFNGLIGGVSNLDLIVDDLASDLEKVKNGDLM